ncbi:hypothetical protein LVB87_03130 [Lysobacter sp. KIS68-7]|uniref:hypothetical protein n=1 Tax=Lysobacter sp. KIS68-7 TaxID=2904252 RepID=UPI001E5C9CEF|nr:hypothetical protein [Lysobacter sp. KIS68-7]UHQ20169.1 hypothetical protein LVB87_03130 [Lysobacter sp. KIS68-7]
MRLHTLALALLCVLATPAFADEPAQAAPKVKWVLPWKQGVALSYQTEDTATEVKDGATSRTRATDTTHVRIAEASDAGFVQVWSSENGTYDVLEGPPALQAQAIQQRATIAALSGVPLEVKLATDGTYAGVRNLDTLIAKIRAVTAPTLLVAIESQMAQIEDPKAREKARATAKANTDAALDRMLTPAYVEALLTRQIQDYDGFHGLEIEPDQSYEVQTALPNPFGGPAFPAKLTFSMSVSPDDPEDLFVAWDMQIDPEKAAVAALAISEKLAGKKLDNTGKDAVTSLDIADEGLIVVHRPTGVVEMYESTRTTQLPGQLKKVERHRMRLLDGQHEHYWRDEETADAGAPAKAEGS